MFQESMEAKAAPSVTIGVCGMVCSHVGGPGRRKLEACLGNNLQDTPQESFIH